MLNLRQRALFRVVGGLAILLAIPLLAPAQQPGYTNHAGNVVPGVVVALDAIHVTLGAPGTQGTIYPLSIFPDSEQRRLAADFGQPRLPESVRRAVTGAEKAIARSRQRAAKGLCSQEESAAFIARTEAALAHYLDDQLASGAITSVERAALGH